MKKLFSVLLLLAIFLGLAACSSDEPAATEPAFTMPDKPGTKYTLTGISLDGQGYMNETALTDQTGGEDLFLILYEDGTALLKIQSGDPVEMAYDDTHIWRPSDPQTRDSYELNGKFLTVTGYPFIYKFEHRS